MASVNVRLNKELEQRLAEEAAHTGLRRNDIIRLAVRRWLAGRRPLGAEERFTRVEHLIGRFDTGPADLAERHGEYLKRKLRHGQEHLA